MKKFSLRYGQVSPFNTHVTRLAEALCDGFQIRFTRKMPRGAEALCDLEKKIILLPELDPLKLNEVEGQKVYAYSAHERKHARLSSQKTFENCKKIMGDSKKNKKSRSVFHSLLQIIEDCRIEMNENYAQPGDLCDLAFCRQNFCEKIIIDEEFKTKNPIGYVINCLQYNLLTQHENFTFLKLPEVPNSDPIWQEFFDRGWKILQDGRFKLSTQLAQDGCDTTSELALDIEKAWQDLLKNHPMPDPNEEGQEGQEGQEKNGEGTKKNNKNKERKGNPSKGDEKENDSRELYDDVNELFDKMQGKETLEIDLFSKEMEDLMEEHGIRPPSKKTDPNPNREEISRQSNLIGFNIHDREIVALPKEDVFKKVLGNLSPQISHVRDILAVYLKSLTQCHQLRYLRNGKLDPKLFYRTAKGIDSKYVSQRKIHGEDFSVSVSIVVDLSGSMGSVNGWSDSSLSRSALAMQMAILLAEVFNLLEIPFEIVGFNTDEIPGYNRYDYREKKDSGYRSREYINYWIFKSFDDIYTLDETRHRLGSITGTGCNVDHEVIYWAAGRLWVQPTKRKLQIILSDGQPSGYGGNYNGFLDHELKRINEEIVSRGIEQFAFGLQSGCVKNYYRDYLILEKMEDLNREALNMFASYLLKGKTK